MNIPSVLCLYQILFQSVPGRAVLRDSPPIPCSGMPDSHGHAEFPDPFNGTRQSMGKSLRIRLIRIETASVHQIHHLPERFIGLALKVLHMGPHIIQDHPFHRNPLILKLPTFIQYSFLADPDLHSVPAAPPQILKQFRVGSLSAQPAAIAQKPYRPAETLL